MTIIEFWGTRNIVVTRAVAFSSTPKFSLVSLVHKEHVSVLILENIAGIKKESHSIIKRQVSFLILILSLPFSERILGHCGLPPLGVKNFSGFA